MDKICPNMSCPSVHRSIELIWLCEGELLRSCKTYANAVGQPACYFKLVSRMLPTLLSLCLEVLPFETEIIGWWSGPQLDQQSLSSIVPLQIHGNKGTSRSSIINCWTLWFPLKWLWEHPASHPHPFAACPASNLSRCIWPHQPAVLVIVCRLRIILSWKVAGSSWGPTKIYQDDQHLSYLSTSCKWVGPILKKWMALWGAIFWDPIAGTSNRACPRSRPTWRVVRMVSGIANA